MGRDADGQPAAFSTLHAIVDASRELNDVVRENNGARIPRGEVLPVDPVAFEVRPSKVPAGGELLVAGEGLGPGPGRVLFHMAGIEMEEEFLRDAIAASGRAEPGRWPRGTR